MGVGQRRADTVHLAKWKAVAAANCKAPVRSELQQLQNACDT